MNRLVQLLLRLVLATEPHQRRTRDGLRLPEQVRLVVRRRVVEGALCQVQCGVDVVLSEPGACQRDQGLAHACLIAKSAPDGKRLLEQMRRLSEPAFLEYGLAEIGEQLPLEKAQPVTTRKQQAFAKVGQCAFVLAQAPRG